MAHLIDTVNKLTPANTTHPLIRWGSGSLSATEIGFPPRLHSWFERDDHNKSRQDG